MKTILIFLALLGSQSALAHSKCTRSALDAAKNFVSMKTQISSSELVSKDYQEWPTNNFEVLVLDQQGRIYDVRLSTNPTTCQARLVSISTR